MNIYLYSYRNCDTGVEHIALVSPVDISVRFTVTSALLKEPTVYNLKY